MNIEITHVALYTKDLEKSKNYYQTFFGALCNELYRNKKGFSSYFLSFDKGPRLELMHYDELELRKVYDRITGYSHIAFSVGSRENVMKLTDRIVKAGYELYSPPRETGDGYYESCVSDPDGNRVEITI